MTSWEVWECDLGHGVHPVVIVSHPARAANKDVIELLDCSTQRAARAPLPNEIILDTVDGMNWPTFCKCDLIYSVHRADISLTSCRIEWKAHETEGSRILSGYTLRFWGRRKQ